MKNFILILLLAAGFTACQKYDDTELLETIDDQAAQIEQLQSQINTLANALEASTTTLAQAIGDNTEAIVANAQAINDANNAITSNLNALNALNADVQDLYTNVANTESSLIALIGERVAELNADIASGDVASADALAAEVAILRSEIAAAQAAAEAYADANDDDTVYNDGGLVAQLNTLDGDLTSLESQVNSNTTAIAQLRSDLTSLSSTLNTVVSDLNVTSTNVLALQDSVSAFNNAVQSITSSVSLNYQWFTSLEGLLNQVRDWSIDNNTNINSLTGDLRTLTDRLNDLIASSYTDWTPAFSDNYGPLPTGVSSEVRTFDQTRTNRITGASETRTIRALVISAPAISFRGIIIRQAGTTFQFTVNGTQVHHHFIAD